MVRETFLLGQILVQRMALSVLSSEDMVQETFLLGQIVVQRTAQLLLWLQMLLL